MRLTKKEIKRISEEYNLGTVKKFKLIKGGLVNHNYTLQTEKNNYIIRIVGDNSTKKLKHLRLQFKITKYLENNNFPYPLPTPLKSSNSKEITNINNKKVWVYKMIKGKNFDRPNLPQMKSMAKALAIYHKHIKKIRFEGFKDSSYQRIVNNFKKLNKLKPKDESDHLGLNYKDYFLNIFKNLKIDLDRNKLYLHGDFDSSNVLFKKDEVIAIIDFDDLSYAPRIFDIAVSIRDSCYTKGKLNLKRAKIFVKEYEKVTKLSKKEKEMIIPIILYANIDFFTWILIEMKKEKENKKKYLKEMIEITKDIIDNNKKL